MKIFPLNDLKTEEKANLEGYDMVALPFDFYIAADKFKQLAVEMHRLWEETEDVPIGDKDIGLKMSWAKIQNVPLAVREVVVASAKEVNSFVVEDSIQSKENTKMTEERERTYVTVPAAFAKEETRKSDGEKFNVMTIPKGVTLNDRDISGYQFYPKFMDVKDGKAFAPYYGDYKILLTKGVPAGDGKYTLEKIDDVDPKELNEAIQKVTRAYDEEHHLIVPIQFTRDNDKFYGVTIPAGVFVGDRDLGGYSFTVNKTFAKPTKDGNYLRVAFKDAMEFSMSKTKGTQVDGKFVPEKDDAGKDVKETIKVSAKDLKDAIDEEHRTYIEDRKKTNAR